MRQINIEERKREILYSIVESYVENAFPVGSRAIAQRFRWTISPATIRNVMVDLEELGLITHPHTSAGRVPTDKGYRYYVDSLLSPKHLTKDEENMILKIFNRKFEDFDSLMQKASNAISMITNVVGVVLTPRLKRSTFKHIELIQINSSRILAVLMTGAGYVKNSIFTMEEEISKSEILRINEFLNQELEGMFLGEIRNHLTSRLLQERDSFYNFLNKAMTILSSADLLKMEDRMYFEGTTSIMSNPEFSDIKKTRLFLRCFEDKKDLFDLFNEDIEKDGIKVHIGKENHCKYMQDYSVITSNYKVRGRIVGVLGAIGPTRMEYGKVITCVEYLSEVLGKVLEKLG
ncbi:MAG: heat-inducible transcriptional repressor HrcA [Candidatus Omnitrophota bacterium]